jgi:undecaprenyl diphosphate synthase
MPPRHVGLIPDGTRRWARLHSVDLEQAYLEAFRRVAAITDHLYAKGVNAVSLYFLSRRNLGRTPAELRAVFSAETQICREDLYDVCQRRGAYATVAGNTNLVPKEFRRALTQLADAASSRKRRLYLCVGYDPFEDVVRACDAPAAGVLAALQVPEALDLVIRTSGVYSLSDFLPLQSAYAQLHFVPERINDLTVATVDRILDTFQATEKRWGL